jgi:myosin heavy subunit
MSFRAATIQLPVEDLTTLPRLTEEDILTNLKLRYKQREIYVCLSLLSLILRLSII